jgi:hypothetical protein
MRLCVQRLLPAGMALVVMACGGGLLAGSAQAEGCPNEQLRAEQPYGPGLPDCRAYELISPQDKNNSDILEGHARASVSGDAVVYASPGAFAEPPGEAAGSLLENRYIARRTATGWSTQNIDEPYTAYETVINAPYEQLIFTPDLATGALQVPISPPLAQGALAGYPNLYIGDIAKGSYRALTTLAPKLSTGFTNEEYEEPPYNNPPYAPSLAGASTDLSHVVFMQKGSLTADASFAQHHLYEWVNGQVSLVDQPPEGVAFTGVDSIGAPNHQEDIGLYPGDAWHAVSADGSRVFFTGGEPGRYFSKQHGDREEEGAGQLYLREVNAGTTIEVSASQRASADPNGPQAARFWAASADGSRVFFTSRAELTEDANTGSADDAPNLYEYNVEDGVLSDLSVDTRPGDVNGASIRGVVTVSDDGSYVYFVAYGDLAGAASSGKPNLYVSHGGNLTFIATLVDGEENGRGDEHDWSREDPFEVEGEGGPGTHDARVSSDGRRLAFVSRGRLTGYDNEAVEPGKCGENNMCSEVYLFDASSGLTCASCNPSGAQPVGPSKLGGHEGGLPESFSLFSASQFYMQRNFTEDSSRLFFESRDALLPHAGDGRQNVYEYEAGGGVRLLSDGAGNYDSFFLDASPSGNDVFIATADRLLATDRDHYIDLYDVRVGGGLPASSSVPDCENGDSCKPPASAQPAVFGTPASGTFSGVGNMAPRSPVKPVVKPKAKSKQCKKGFVYKHGRCVKQRRKRSSVTKRGRQ